MFDAYTPEVYCPRRRDAVVGPPQTNVCCEKPAAQTGHSGYHMLSESDAGWFAQS